MSRLNSLVLVLAVGLCAPPLFAQETAPRTLKVTIKGFVFDPPEVDAKPGDTIVWSNDDFAPHTATSDNRTFDTHGLKNGESGSFTPQATGVFAYHCAYHPHMKGIIRVKAP